MPIFIYQRTRDGNPVHGWDQWVLFGGRPEVFFTKYLSLAFGGLRPYSQQHWPIRRLAAQIHHRASNWRWPPVLQPPSAPRILDLRELVRWTARISGRDSLPESDGRPYVWSASGNVVVEPEVREMASPEMTTSSSAIQNASPVTIAENYTRPLAIVTTLFFMWGFITSLNDILVPHLKSIFELSYARVMLIQFAFFSAYFLRSEE